MSNPYAPPDPTRPRPQRRRPPAAPLRPLPPEPPAEPPSPEQQRAVTRGVMAFGGLMLLSLLAGQLPVPWVLAAPVAGVLSVVVGLRLIRLVRRLRWRGLLPVMLAAGVGLTLLVTLLNGVTLLFWDEYAQAQDCRERAITISAQARCETELQEGIAERLDRGEP